MKSGLSNILKNNYFFNKNIFYDSFEQFELLINRGKRINKYSIEKLLLNLRLLYFIFSLKKTLIIFFLK